MGIHNLFKNSRYPIYYSEEEVNRTEDAHDDGNDGDEFPEAAGKDGNDGDELPEAHQPLQISWLLENALSGKKKRRQKPINSFSVLSTEDGDEMNTTVISKRPTGGDDYDSDLQTALLLSQTQADEDNDEEFQKALLLSSMESSLAGAKPNLENLDKNVDSSELGDLMTNPNLGDLKLKGVCGAPEMNPDRVELAPFSKLLLGEASTSACAVCSDEQPTGKLTRLSDRCGHFCCKGCADDYLGRAIKENIHAKIRCPGTKCKEIFPGLRHVPPEVVERRDNELKQAKALKELGEEEARKSFFGGFWGRHMRNMMRDPRMHDDWHMRNRMRDPRMRDDRHMRNMRDPRMRDDRHMRNMRDPRMQNTGLPHSEFSYQRYLEERRRHEQWNAPDEFDYESWEHTGLPHSEFSYQRYLEERRRYEQWNAPDEFDYESWEDIIDLT